jgi:enoyl-CoA hydratase/carnithine racemase
VIVRGDARSIAVPGSIPVVVAWLGSELGGVGPCEADLVIGPDDVDALAECVEQVPLAATTLAVLLRAIEHADVDHGLAMESAAYSMLQAGPEFEAWRAGTAPRPAIDDANPVVRIERDGDELLVTLDRPQRHNAISTRLRDELVEALALAETDRSIRRVVLRGNGPSFCSGGDLAEFGSRPDPATAHITRLARSPARLMHRLRDRATVEIHGATLGGGIEIAAFAGHVHAAPDTVIGLPELSLGLIPGAGGTVSVSSRAGRQRTAALALTGRHIDAATAARWHLVDEVAPHTSAS